MIDNLPRQIRVAHIVKKHPNELRGHKWRIGELVICRDNRDVYVWNGDNFVRLGMADVSIEGDYTTAYAFDLWEGCKVTVRHTIDPDFCDNGGEEIEKSAQSIIAFIGA